MRCGCGQTRHYEWCQSSTDDVYILRRSCLEAASLSPATAVPGPAVILLLNSLRWLTLTPPTTQPRQMIITYSSPVTMCIGWQYLGIFNLGVIIISACTKYTLGTVHFTPRSVSLSPMMTWPMICRYLVFLSPCLSWAELVYVSSCVRPECGLQFMSGINMWDYCSARMMGRLRRPRQECWYGHRNTRHRHQISIHRSWGILYSNLCIYLVTLNFINAHWINIEYLTSQYWQTGEYN